MGPSVSPLNVIPAQAGIQNPELGNPLIMTPGDGLFRITPTKCIYNFPPQRPPSSQRGVAAVKNSWTAALTLALSHRERVGVRGALINKGSSIAAHHPAIVELAIDVA